MTRTFKMLIKKSINRFRLFHSTIVFTKLFLQSTTSLPNILHVTVFGWMDELGFYVPSTVFQSFRDDGRVNMKGSVQ